MKYVFHPEALTEYADAVRYYTEQRTEVTQAFIDAIKDADIGLENLPLAIMLLIMMFGNV